MALTLFGRIPVGRLCVVPILLISALASPWCCHGSDFVFISNSGASSVQEELQTATTFYGLNLRIVTANSGGDGASMVAAVHQKDTVGVAIDARALATVNHNALLQALNRKNGGAIPLLILGIGPNLNPSLMRNWSNGSVSGCRPLEGLSDPKYVFGRVEGLTWQLANIDVPLPTKDTSYLVIDDSGAAQRIASVRNEGKISPVFIENTIGQQKVFAACATGQGKDLGGDEDVVGAFLRIAPAMIFVRYSAGERGWHALHYFANFTIDDPWLRQPYGYVDYKGLFEEMEKHNFHTTIAFIPWNYNRSEPEVVSLFRSHPERFSIAIHGNNHDHKEFSDFRSIPLADQISDVKQALARMERFRTLTGLPYDKVMIFPHSIAPEGTLAELKTYNYMATVNSTNVPEDMVSPYTSSFVLRPMTLSFAGFPSLRRYSVDAPISRSFLAISEFLDRPLLFYGHSDSFAHGINAFDGVADEVNQLEPATEWRSLGEIVRHLYMVKLRDDSNYDVLAFSNNICLDNTAGRNVTFYVQKHEIGSQTIDSVTVDGKVHAYALQGDQINLAVAIPTDGKSCLMIRYANDLQLASVSVAHDSLLIYLLRMGSDFRDIYLAKSRVGLAAIRFYNEHRLKPAEVIGCLFLLLVILIYAGWRMWVSLRRRFGSMRPARALTN
ncbi:MAG TPA: hypothetical protein VMG82_27980 [Candidatus Sulfotelmatobacter sp.]|nr:hypothetical protein [Candidatus Sulfotelmatobacter sp.]